MTENERFTVTAYEFYDNGEPILGEDVCKLLNELHEENEELKHQLITLDGLYVSDKEDMSEVWRLDLFSDDAE